MIDYHIHTNTSPDAQQALGDVIKKARRMGMSHIAITDHYEFMDGEKYKQWAIKDGLAYSQKIQQYNNQYDDISIARGIEIGHLNDKTQEIKKVLDTMDLDFVIASAHFAQGYDLYFPEFFAGKSKEQAYYEYFEEIAGSIDFLDERTSVLGHIGYGAKFSPYDDRSFDYGDYKEIIDEILIKAIKRGFGIELNTSGYSSSLKDLLPGASVVKRYKELGGEIITIGSDAHRINEVGRGFQKARQAALDAGFKHLSVFKNFRNQFIPL